MEAQRNFIERAAALLGKKCSDFMLEAACREAEHVLLDQCLVMLDSEKYAAFSQAHGVPLRDNPALQKLMTCKSPWE